MSTVLKFQIISTSSKNTEEIAESIGKNLKGGEVIELISDLGGGKTVFTKGLVRGGGSKDLVASPTFTISKVYKAFRFVINHFDFYRLNDAGVVAQELAESVSDPEAVTVLEWAQIVKDVLPAKRLSVAIEQTAEENRRLLFTYHPSLEYLFKDLK